MKQELDTLLASMPSSSEQFKKVSRKTELLGPRPPPLKVCKESCKIRKLQPSLAAPAQPILNHRPPVIIYTRSPEVIHANAHNFMTLVQRLTGSSSSSCSSSSLSQSSLPTSSLSSSTLSPPASLNSYAQGRDASKSIIDISEAKKIGSLHVADRLQESITDASGNQILYSQEVLSLVPSALPPMSPTFFQPSPNAFPSLHDFGLPTPNYQDTLFVSSIFNL